MVQRQRDLVGERLHILLSPPAFPTSPASCRQMGYVQAKDAPATDMPRLGMKAGYAMVLNIHKRT